MVRKKETSAPALMRLAGVRKVCGCVGVRCVSVDGAFGVVIVCGMKLAELG